MFSECTMGMEEQTAQQTKLAPKLFIERACKTGKKTVPHHKMVPECKNVTKQNCVTNWENDSYGKQVTTTLIRLPWSYFLPLSRFGLAQRLVSP